MQYVELFHIQWNHYVKIFTLKKISPILVVEAQRGRKARKVVMPPFRTAGPMLVKAWDDLSFVVPGNTSIILLLLGKLTKSLMIIQKYNVNFLYSLIILKLF